MNSEEFRAHLNKYNAKDLNAKISEAISGSVVVGDLPPVPTHDGRRGFFLAYEELFPSANALQMIGYEIVVCPRTGRHIVLPNTPDERRVSEKDEVVLGKNTETLRAILDKKDAIIDAMESIDLAVPAVTDLFKLGAITDFREFLGFVTTMYPSRMPIDLVAAAQLYMARIGMLRGTGGLDEFRERFHGFVENSMFELDAGRISAVFHRLFVPVTATAEFVVEEIDEDSAFLRVSLEVKNE